MADINQEGADGGLLNLASTWRGELREKNLAGRVLADFVLIQRLRGQKCPWHRIASAMGANPDSLRKLFAWTARQIKAGVLEPPKPDQPPPVPTRRQAQAISTGAATGEPPPERAGFKRLNID